MRQTGRCLCGEVTYAFSGTPVFVGHCHCESCRRNCSAPMTTFVGIPRDAFEFTGVEPGIYESSPGVRRLFCRTCGAPVAYDADNEPGEIHVYLAALDNPEAYDPTHHVFAGEQLSWFDKAYHLPRYPRDRTDEAPIVAKSQTSGDPA
ncbi:MAG: GFA family protein [Hyphomicrobiaceae bacterium]